MSELRREVVDHDPNPPMWPVTMRHFVVRGPAGLVRARISNPTGQEPAKDSLLRTAHVVDVTIYTATALFDGQKRTPNGEDPGDWFYAFGEAAPVRRAFASGGDAAVLDVLEALYRDRIEQGAAAEQGVLL